MPVTLTSTLKGKIQSDNIFTLLNIFVGESNNATELITQAGGTSPEKKLMKL